MAQTKKDAADAAKADAPGDLARQKAEQTAPLDEQRAIQSGERAEELANGVADPAPAPALTEASGAILEPEIAQAVDVDHESVDNNPRAGTTALQNAVDWNDAHRRTPADDEFAGQGLDPVPYGRPAKASS